MLKKESTKLGYIADYKKDVDDIVDLLKGYSYSDEIKKNFLSSVVEIVERTYDITIECEFQDIEGFEYILPNKFRESSKKISQDLEKEFWGFLYSIYKNLGSEDEAKSLILEYIDEQDFGIILSELDTDFHTLFVDIRESYYNASITVDETNNNPDN